VFSLRHFYKLPSIVQIMFAEFGATMFLGALAPYAYRAIWPQPQLVWAPPALDWGDAVFGAIGLALLIWLMWGPLFPRVVPVSWTPVFSTSNAIAVNPSWSVEYAFPTNHPSYVFIDLIVIGFWGFFRWLMWESNDERLYEANIWVAVAAIVPAWRLICWYILRRRPDARGMEDAVRAAWKPVASLYVWCIGPLLAAFLAAYIYESTKSRRILAAMPTVDATSFSEQTFAELRNPDIKDKEMTRLIRLRASQRSGEAQRCFDRERRPSVAVLADFGRHGIVIIQNERTSRDDLGLETLVERAKGNAGKTIEAIGHLTRLPADREIPGWRRPFFCGLERSEPRPRWLLEESKP
jgi:hypothetical protein